MLHESEMDFPKEESSYQISVVIPVCNTARYIRQCVDSVLNQKFKDVEIIIVDDASTDRSYEIAKEFYEGMSNITIIRNGKNLGQGESRNIGLKTARGKYVYFMDSDDYILPHGLESLYLTAEKYQADIVHNSEWYESAEEELDFSGDVLVNYCCDTEYKSFPYRMNSDIRNRIKEAFVDGGCMVAPWLKLYKRIFLLDKGIFFPAMRLYEASPFAFACYAATDRIWSQPGPFAIYRIREGSTMSDKSYNHLTKSTTALAVGFRSLQKIIQKSVEPLDESFKEQVYISFFWSVYANILPFYDSGATVAPEVTEAVNKAIISMFPQDYIMISLLHYYFGSNIGQLKAVKDFDEM